MVLIFPVEFNLGFNKYGHCGNKNFRGMEEFGVEDYPADQLLPVYEFNTRYG